MTPDLEARLKRLERQNLFLGVVALGAVAVLSVAQLRASKTVHLVSADGTSEARLEANRLVFTRGGQKVLALVAGDDLTGLVAASADGDAQVALTPEVLSFRVDEKPTVGIVSRGEGQNRGLGLHDDSGRPRALLGLSTGGLPSVWLSGSNPNVVALLNINEEDVQRVAFTRGNGKLATALRNGDDWGGCTSSDGKAEATLQLETTGAAGVVLVDGQGHRTTYAAHP
jgi:hypothetical protein